MIYNLIKKSQHFALFPDHIKDSNHYTYFIFKSVGKPFWVKDKHGNAIKAILRGKREQRLSEIPLQQRSSFCEAYSVSEAMFKSQLYRKPALLIDIELVEVNEVERMFV